MTCWKSVDRWAENNVVLATFAKITRPPALMLIENTFAQVLGSVDSFHVYGMNWKSQARSSSLPHSATLAEATLEGDGLRM